MSGSRSAPRSECRYDLVALGEIMLRLDPGEGRIRTARGFRAWEGGGEYNVARGLRRCFGLRTAVVTAFADNEVGRLLEDFVLQGGVDTRLIRWVPSTASAGRCATASTSPSAASACAAPSACPTAATRPPRSCGRATSTGSISSARLGVRWFHTGGIFAALSETTPEVVDRGGCRGRSATARSSRTTSTTGRACGRGSAASSGRGRSTAGSRRTST